MNDNVIRLHFRITGWEIAGYLFGLVWIVSVVVLVISFVQLFMVGFVSVSYPWMWLGMFIVSTAFWIYIFRTSDKKPRRYRENIETDGWWDPSSLEH